MTSHRLPVLSSVKGKPSFSIWLVLLTLFVLSFQAQAFDPSARIVGGTKVPDNKYPFMVALYFDPLNSGTYSPGCGGSLLSDKWILTAAHCVVDAQGAEKPLATIAVLVGALDLTDKDQGNLIGVADVIVHPAFSLTTQVNDIALIELQVPVNEFVIELPAAGSNIPTAGESAIVAGWGRTTENGFISGPLLEVDLPVLAHVQCLPFYIETLRSDANVCAGASAAGGADSCQGDSGGPLFVERNGFYVQAGIVSYGFGCGRPNIPGVYTRTSNYTQWVASIVPDLIVNRSGVGIDRSDEGLVGLEVSSLNALSATQSSSLAAGKVSAYELDGVARIEISTFSGRVGLLIFNGSRFDVENVVCVSAEPSINSCNIPASNARQFAVVFSFESSSYQLSVSDRLPANDGISSGSSGGGGGSAPLLVALMGIIMLRRRANTEPRS